MKKNNDQGVMSNVVVINLRVLVIRYVREQQPHSPFSTPHSLFCKKKNFPVEKSHWQLSIHMSDENRHVCGGKNCQGERK
jgi:hypothetical protein